MRLHSCMMTSSSIYKYYFLQQNSNCISIKIQLLENLEDRSQRSETYLPPILHLLSRIPRTFSHRMHTSHKRKRIYSHQLKQKFYRCTCNILLRFLHILFLLRCIEKRILISLGCIIHKTKCKFVIYNRKSIHHRTNNIHYWVKN